MAKKSGGFSPIIIIIVVIIIIFGAGGYLYLSKSSTSFTIPFVNNMPIATEKDFEFVTDPLVKKHFVAQANQTSFRIKSLSSGRGQGAIITEVQLKGKEYSTSTITEDQNGKEISYLILIADTTYVKDYKDNKWWKEVPKPLPTNATQQKDIIPTPESFKDELSKKTKTEYKQLGTENCGTSAPELTCYKYQETDPENTEGNRIFWFDNSKFLLRKEEAAFGEFKSISEYSYDNIAINAPSPVKEVPEGKSIYEMMYSGGSSNPQEIQQLQQKLPVYSQPENNYQEQQAPNIPSEENFAQPDDTGIENTGE